MCCSVENTIHMNYIYEWYAGSEPRMTYAEKQMVSSFGTVPRITPTCVLRNKSASFSSIKETGCCCSHSLGFNNTYLDVRYFVKTTGYRARYYTLPGVDPYGRFLPCFCFCFPFRNPGVCSISYVDFRKRKQQNHGRR